MDPTQSFLEPLAESRFCLLLPGCRVRDVADACRSAALGFAWSAHQGWGRRELARWLAGPYARAAAATRILRVPGTRLALAPRPVDETEIEALLGRARSEVLDVLRNAWSWSHDATATRAWLNEGLVAGIADGKADLGFAPVDRAGMRLVDRVRSLFIADYLTRPSDYAAFAVCEDCDGATFDGALYHRDCSRPRGRTVLRRRSALDLEVPDAIPLSGVRRRVG
jgi:hypothetical protein